MLWRRFRSSFLLVYFQRLLEWCLGWNKKTVQNLKWRFLAIIDDCQLFTIDKSTCILDISVFLHPLLDTYLIGKSKQVWNKGTFHFYKENRRQSLRKINAVYSWWKANSFRRILGKLHSQNRQKKEVEQHVFYKVSFLGFS